MTTTSLGPRPRLAVDLSAVEVVTSAHLGVLSALMRRVERRQGRLVLFGLRDHVRALLGETGLSSHFLIREGREEAVEALRAARSS